MNKKDLIAAIQAKGLTKAEAIKAVEGFMVAVAASLARGEKVTLFGFGAFSLVKHRPRTRRNPRTGEKVAVPAQTTISFNSGKHLSDHVNRRER